MEGLGDLGGIARKIAIEHLDNQEDLERFKQVCSLWRSETNDIQYLWPRNNYQLPWLMVVDSADNNRYRRFYSLSKAMLRKIDLPQLDEDQDPEDRRMYFSSKGWLVGISSNRALIYFYHVFTSQLMVPPSVPLLSLRDGDIWDDHSYLSHFNKFIFSHHKHPASSEDDFEVAMVFDITQVVAFWRPGQVQWIKPEESLRIMQVEDVCFFRGEFYSIDHYSRVIAYGNQTPKQPRVVATLRSQGLCKDGFDKFYIVPLQTTLLVIYREINSPDDDSFEYWTPFFLLFEVNVENGKATQVHGIGNRALFVGRCSTFFVEASACASNQSGYRPNCIYFTDDYGEGYCCSPQGGGRDMGIFSLEENKVVDQLYNGPSKFDYVNPPMWMQLPPY